MRRGQGDFLRLIEAAYRTDCTNAEWLRGLAGVANDELGAGLGLLGCEYRVDTDRIIVGETSDIAAPPELASLWKARLEKLPPWFVRKSFVRCECTTQSAAHDAKMHEFSRPSREALANKFGIHDILMVGGMDPSGDGVFLGAYLPVETSVPATIRKLWSRVAVHLVTAQRLRRQLATVPARRAEAILDPAGRVVDGSDSATTSEARDALRTAVLTIELARSSMRRTNPDLAVDGWKGLVSARWTLVEQFESDGKRYIVARRNEADVPELDVLTDREQQVVAFAALGHTNKLIAYQLGIAESTVRVLVHRAARKLGATSRADLVERYRTSLRLQTT